jgi:hypothetical protein
VSSRRRAFGWVLAALGVVLAVVGVGCAFVVGTDSAFSSGSHRLTSDASTIVTADDVIDRVGPTVTVTVSTPDGGPVFVGLGNAVDVDDYLAGSPVTRVDSFSLPWDVTTTKVEGQSAPAADPRDLDWWLVSGSGDGSASIDFPLPDDVVDIVIMDPDRGRGFVADVSVAVEIPGLFAGAVAAAAFGLGLVLAGFSILRRPTARRRDAGERDKATAAEDTPDDGRDPSAEIGAS